MTLEEKLQQIQLLPDFLVTDDGVRKGLGSVLSVTDPQRIRDLQRMAVEESRLKIPILFAFDTIHGFRTVFPIPLAAGASFDPQVASDDHTYGARESAVVGLKQTYAPMVDVSHEPRWGRISEAAGEDPYLNAVLAAARVKAIQGSDYSAPDKLVASPKHFAAYGQPESGRDYNTTDMSEQRLRNLYLPPFKAAVDAGADTVMCSFNAINGVPGCGNDYTMNEILKGEWDFDGFVESDWTAVAEMRACPPKTPDSGECGHGVAADGPSAAALALNSGVDSEMTSTLIRDFGVQLFRSTESRCGASTTPCAGSCASSSAPACSSTPTRRSRPRRPKRRCCDPTRWRPPARRRAARWCCSRTRAGSCRSTPRRRRQ